MIVVGVLCAIGVAIGVAWGWHGSVVFAFFAAIALVFTVAAVVGGSWLEGVSRSRFDRDRQS